MADSRRVIAEPLDERLVGSLLGAGRQAGAASVLASSAAKKIDAWALVDDSSDKCLCLLPGVHLFDGDPLRARPTTA